jgi:hypothetical protein
MAKQRTNNGPLKESADKHSIYTLAVAFHLASSAFSHGVPSVLCLPLTPGSWGGSGSPSPMRLASPILGDWSGRSNRSSRVRNWACVVAHPAYGDHSLLPYHAMQRAYRREYTHSLEAAASCRPEACLPETHHKAPLKVPFCF